ncbi:hypothetical protein PENTCL1PPCAC_19640, partial [Pristionchus entomophagus]
SESKYFLEKLIIEGDDNFGKEIMVKSFVLDLAKSCKVLAISLDYVTLKTIHEVYKIMLNGSGKLHLLEDDFMKNELCIAFLQLIGIIYRDGEFFSNKDIEVYKVDVEDGRDLWHIFDANIEIILEENIFTGLFLDGAFSLRLHETQESLENAKSDERMERIDIGPE